MFSWFGGVLFGVLAFWVFFGLLRVFLFVCFNTLYFQNSLWDLGSRSWA